MDLIDTHCHIQSIGAPGDDFTVRKWREGGVKDPDVVIKDAHGAGVTRLICVGTSLNDSQRAVDSVQERDNCYASVGIHPHEAKNYANPPDLMRQCRDWLGDKKVVAVGEVGLDCYYEHSPKKEQVKLLEYFLQLASEADLPVIFHVRDAYADFWPVYDNFKNLRGVMHSFSATTKELEQALERGLYVGLNGIMTFTRDQNQLAAAKAVPLDNMLLETDAPYLTPKPFRGKVCKPEHVKNVAEFLAELRNEALDEVADHTTNNARKLFGIT